MLTNSNIQLIQSCRGRNSTYFIQQKLSKRMCLPGKKCFVYSLFRNMKNKQMMDINEKSKLHIKENFNAVNLDIE